MNDREDGALNELIGLGISNEAIGSVVRWKLNGLPVDSQVVVIPSYQVDEIVGDQAVR